MPRTSLRSILAMAGLHLVLLVIAGTIAYDSFEAMDDPDWTPSMVGRISEVTVDVLIQPGFVLWESIGGGAENPDALEWAVFIANSLLWGAVLAFLRTWWLRRRLTRMVPND